MNQYIKYYTCKYDRVFKDIFLDSKDTSLLKGLLESILKIEINSITIQNSELLEGNAYLRRKTLDVLLDTNQGIINIEINSSSDTYNKIRNFAFLSKVYSNQTLRGENYDSTQQFIQINLTYNLKDNCYNRTYYIQDETKKKFISNVKIVEFNMDKYVNLWYTDDKEKILANKYLIMMNLPKDELEIFSKKDKVVKEYMNKLNRINEDPAFLNLMDYEEDNRRIMNSMKNAAIKKGLEEGREEGREEGIKLVAKNLLKRNHNIEEISEITGLSIKELEVLKEE